MWCTIFLVTCCLSINIFIVPHPHIDVGWLKPIDSYYTSHARNILNNIITLLTEFPESKFLWSEAVFLQRYLSEFPENIPRLKQFLVEGRLEIVGGGWWGTGLLRRSYSSDPGRPQVFQECPRCGKDQCCLATRPLRSFQSDPCDLWENGLWAHGDVKDPWGL